MPKFSLPGLVLLLGSGVIAAGFLTAVATNIQATPSGPCEAPYQPGKASSLVSLVEQDNGEPGVSFPTPLKTTGREISVITAGAGQPAYASTYVDFDVNIFLGQNLEYLTGSSYDPQNPIRRVIAPEDTDFFGVILECATPGSVLAVTTTVEDLFGTIEEDEFIQNGSTIVALIDVHNTYPTQAHGSARLPQSGLPTVVTTTEGVHGLSFPNAPIPTELRVSVLKQGTGEALREGAFVTAHFTGVVWNTREVFVSSFDRGVPLSLSLYDQTTNPSGVGVIPGLAQALIGQTVGSQVLVSVPPALGYQPGQTPFGVPEGATLLYVFDILGVTQ
jgi:peptidylprolyl isomerase